MALSTNKKVFVTRFEREAVHGFVQTPGGLMASAVELLSPAGNLLQIPYTEVKAVSFVRDFESGNTWREHRSFAARPKTPGLWLRLVFRDGDTTEGVIPNNLMNVEETGFNIIPPDPSFQNQRIFVPRAALREVQVLGVVGSPLRRKKPARPETPADDQLEMFS